MIEEESPYITTEVLDSSFNAVNNESPGQNMNSAETIFDSFFKRYFNSFYFTIFAFVIFLIIAYIILVVYVMPKMSK